MDINDFVHGFTFDEVRCLLYAFDSKMRYCKNGDNESSVKEFCSHSHEKEFLCKNDSILLNNRVIRDKNTLFLFELYEKMNSLSDIEPAMEPLVSGLLEETEDKHYCEVLVWCASLLIDFHFDLHCSEYMSLALKFYLQAYNFGRFPAKPVACATDLLNYLRYISASPYKYQRELFRAYIEQFLWKFIWQRSPERFGRDSICPILGVEVFELAHQLHIDILLIWDTKSVYIWRKYIRFSVLDNFGKYLFKTKHCFEDQYYEDTIKEYKEAIIEADRNNVFHCQDIIKQGSNYVMYRSLQVLFLYIKCIYYGTLNASIGASELGEETLQCLWETTPAPFLSRSQFLSCFEEFPPELDRAWDWYERKVLADSDSPENSPRSLMHISKCAVRRRLSECDHIPDSVKSLVIPVTLKSYLRLV